MEHLHGLSRSSTIIGPEALAYECLLLAFSFAMDVQLYCIHLRSCILCHIFLHVVCLTSGLERPQFFLGSSDDEDVAYSILRPPSSCQTEYEDIQSLDDDDVGYHGIPNSTLLEYGTEDIATLFGLAVSSLQIPQIDTWSTAVNWVWLVETLTCV